MGYTEGEIERVREREREREREIEKERERRRGEPCDAKIDTDGDRKRKEAPWDVKKEQEIKSERIRYIERGTVGCTKGARDKE